MPGDSPPATGYKTCCVIYIITIVLLCTEQIILEDPLFKRDDKYYLSTEESFDRIVEKSVRYITIKNRLADGHEGIDEDIMRM